MNDKRKDLANLLFPNVKKSIEFYENLYKTREENGEVVTRFAPSPTGYMHIGGLYVSLINQSFAKQKNGTFYLRIEDTDQSRILENGVSEIIKTLKNFAIEFDEGPINENEDFGNYGPYRQSERKEIYQTYAKYLVENDLAYPCFCSKEEIEAIKEQQMLENSNIWGYAGKYAKCRNLSVEESIEKVKNGQDFVIRLKSPSNQNKRVVVNDVVRGELEMDSNEHDVVIIKGDGLPTYHFAHVIDDHLMHTTHVIRADEWIASLPIHIQMFKMLNFKIPKYAHVCPILKMDGNAKRKLSKRKDPEARVGYYFEQGFPIVAVKEYLLNLINSRFEIWRTSNPHKPYQEFTLKLSEMSNSGALFDMAKLANVSKKLIKNMTDEEVGNYILDWAKNYSKTLYAFILKNQEKFFASINIWHKNRMDVSKWSEVETQYDYLYNENFYENFCIEEENKQLLLMPFVNDILTEYLNTYNHNDDSKVWFEKVKQIADKFNYCSNVKEYKNNPEIYNGSIIDVTTFLRVALTGRKDSPDIYMINQYLGEEEVKRRTKKLLDLLEFSKN